MSTVTSRLKQAQFDSKHIMMKRRAEFEREREKSWKSETKSWDSDEYYNHK
jgi:hypothetical protein